MMRTGLVTGHNVDRLDIAAGLRELIACGYPATETERHYVIQYALMRWARGEEEAAERGAIDQSFHGIDLTSWRRVLAAAMAASQTAPSSQKGTDPSVFDIMAQQVKADLKPAVEIMRKQSEIGQKGTADE